MKSITLKVTVEELTLLATLASDELFRREFIDRRMPGFKANPAEVAFGKALVLRLRSILDEDSVGHRASGSTSVTGYALGVSKRHNRIPDAL